MTLPGLNLFNPSTDRTSLPAMPGRRGFWGYFVRNKLGVASLLFIVLVTTACLAAPLIAPSKPDAEDLTSVFAGPSWHHLLGTDGLGRDTLSRLLYGGVVSLTGVGEVLLISIVLGTLSGLVAGYWRGRVDAALSRLADLALAVPAIVVLLMTLAIFSGSQTGAMLALGLLSVAPMFRIVRAATLPTTENGYVLVARLSGLRSPTILRRHILPAVLGPLIVNASVIGASALVIQVGLNFLGLGVQPPSPSWGGMIADAQTSLLEHPWDSAAPGLTVALVILAIVLLGDAIRDSVMEMWSLDGSGLDSGERGAEEAAPRRAETLAEPPDFPQVETDVEDAVAARSALLEVRGVSVWFSAGRSLVTRDVSFSVGAGEMVGLLGESGSGKTVTALAVMGLLPTGARTVSGECWFDGKDILHLGRRERVGLRGKGIGYVGQEPMSSIDPCFTVGAQLGEIMRRRSDWKRSNHKGELAEALSNVGISDPGRVLHSYPHQLSGGMVQRVLIALALAARPRLLVADEPTSALDPTVQAEIMNLLRDLKEQQGLAILLITHDWGVVADSCDRAVVMYAGEVVETGNVGALIRQQRHPYTAALLGALPQLNPPRLPLPAIPGLPPTAQEWGAGCRFASRCQYASEDCRESPIPLVPVGGGRVTRCIHDERMERMSATHD